MTLRKILTIGASTALITLAGCTQEVKQKEIQQDRSSQGTQNSIGDNGEDDYVDTTKIGNENWPGTYSKENRTKYDTKKPKKQERPKPGDTATSHTPYTYSGKNN